MAKKKLEFKPDRIGSGLLSKLYVTPIQRRKLLKWAAYSLLCVAVLVVQDVILGRVNLFGGTIDLVPLVIMLVCVLEDEESGGLFVLLASVFYFYSGSAPGPYCILLLTALSVFAAIFRRNFLQRSFSAHWACTVAAGFGYQTGVWAMGVFLTQTYPARIGAFLMNGLLGALALPALYPALTAIGKIGGQTWKE